jgi:hypothetical protein
MYSTFAAYKNVFKKKQGFVSLYYDITTKNERMYRKYWFKNLKLMLLWAFHIKFWVNRQKKAKDIFNLEIYQRKHANPSTPNPWVRQDRTFVPNNLMLLSL